MNFCETEIAWLTRLRKTYLIGPSWCREAVHDIKGLKKALAEETFAIFHPLFSHSIFLPGTHTSSKLLIPFSMCVHGHFERGYF